MPRTTMRATDQGLPGVGNAFGSLVTRTGLESSASRRRAAMRILATTSPIATGSDLAGALGWGDQRTRFRERTSAGSAPAPDTRRATSTHTAESGIKEGRLGEVDPRFGPPVGAGVAETTAHPSRLAEDDANLLRGRLTLARFHTGTGEALGRPGDRPAMRPEGPLRFGEAGLVCRAEAQGLVLGAVAGDRQQGRLGSTRKQEKSGERCKQKGRNPPRTARTIVRDEPPLRPATKRSGHLRLAARSYPADSRHGSQPTRRGPLRLCCARGFGGNSMDSGISRAGLV